MSTIELKRPKMEGSLISTDSKAPGTDPAPRTGAAIAVLLVSFKNSFY